LRQKIAIITAHRVRVSAAVESILGVRKYEWLTPNL
jgi:hypothetical protein